MLKILEKASPKKWCISAGRRITKKYRKAMIRKIQNREYKRLKSVIPNVAEKEKVSKVAVVEEAIAYIDYLQAEIMHRLYPEEADHCKNISPLEAAMKMLAAAPSEMSLQPTPQNFTKNHQTERRYPG